MERNIICLTLNHTSSESEAKNNRLHRELEGDSGKVIRKPQEQKTPDG